MTWLVVIVGLFALIGGSLGDDKQNQKVKVSILAPTKDNEVARDQSFTVKAKVSGVAEKNEVWACVEAGEGPLYWPKSALAAVKKGEDEWTAEVVQGGEAGKSFRVTLLLVPEKGFAVIEKWLEDGAKKNDFPGLKLRDLSAERLDSVQLKLK